MPKPHDDAIISVPEFWRVLAFVLIGFGVALAVSWSIDAVVSHRAAAIVATTSHA
jgi:hypothetical protein